VLDLKRHGQPKDNHGRWKKTLDRVEQADHIIIIIIAVFTYRLYGVHTCMQELWDVDIELWCCYIECVAALNGVCTKWNTAQFELLPFENKVNNNSQTWPLIHLTSLTTFSSNILLLKWIIPVKEYYEFEYHVPR